MKSLAALSAALLIGSAALAQSPGTQAGQMSPPNVTDGSPPERDARGIPVISAPAMTPPGANQWQQMQPGVRVVPAPNQAMVFASRPADESYPPCTATVTDNCVQAYVGRSRMRMSRR